MARPKYNKAQVVNWISRFKYGNVRSKAYRKQIIETFVNSVYVYDDHFLFTYNFKDSTETVSLQEIESAVCSDMLNGAPPKNPVDLSAGFFFCMIHYAYRLKAHEKLLSTPL